MLQISLILFLFLHPHLMLLSCAHSFPLLPFELYSLPILLLESYSYYNNPVIYALDFHNSNMYPLTVQRTMLAFHHLYYSRLLCHCFYFIFICIILCSWFFDVVESMRSQYVVRFDYRSMNLIIL